MKVQKSTESLRQAASTLHGQVLLIIGGDRRPQQEKRLRDAFSGTQIMWHPTRESNAGGGKFAGLVHRAEVSVVVVVRGLCRHGHTKRVHDLCLKAGKVLLWVHRPTPAAIARALLLAPRPRTHR